MPQFLSTVTNRVDKKGRVSVPAPFRSAVAGQEFPGVVLYPAIALDALEGCGMDRIARIGETIDEMPPFGDERAAFATSILADAQPLTFDGEGRILLPKILMDHAGIEDRATFVGQGAVFQIWEPEAYEAFRTAARQRARSNPAALTWARRGDGAGR